MRRLLILALCFAPLASFAARNTPICDPPPSTSTTCPGGDSSKLWYLNPQLFGISSYDDMRDMCDRQIADRTIKSEWVEVCEDPIQAPVAQMFCLEDSDHAVSCQGAPIGVDFLYAWEADGVIVVADEQTDANKPATSFVCSEPGLGKLTLTVSKPSGASSTIARDIVCSGTHPSLTGGDKDSGEEHGGGGLEVPAPDASAS
jgi:hypothetical protein